jgi:hypothetical protein
MAKQFGECWVRSTLSQRSLVRHPGFAQAVERPFVHLDEAWIGALFGGVRLPCRDGLERRDGGQGKIALQEPTPPRARAAPPKPVRPVKVPVEVEQPPPPRQPSMPVVAWIGR